jgi:hypothetical protein
MISSVVMVLAVGSVAGIITTILFFSLFFPWMRNLQHQIDHLQETLLYAENRNIPQPKPVPPQLMDRTTPPLEEQVEIIAQFQVKRSGETISIVESGGHRYVRMDSEIPRREREQLLRYLKNEGFVD